VSAPERFRLDGKVALVIGGTSGIGQAIAVGYREAAARVVVVGRTPAKLPAARPTIWWAPRSTSTRPPRSS